MLQFGSGFLELAGGAAVAAGSLVLVMMLVALGTYAYKHFRGDGIEWPEDMEEAEADQGGVKRGNDDDEWKYY